MKAHPLIALAVALAACSPEKTPPAPDAPAVTTAPTPFTPLAGDFAATSSTAMGITGNLSVIDTRLTFSNGFLFNTAAATVPDITAPVHKGGDSFAQTMTTPTSLAIELRRVLDVVKASGARVQPLCGADAPSYVALAYDTPATAVSMAVFSGPDAPGPEAVDSALCGTFLYNK